MQFVSRQGFGKHISAYRTVLCNGVTSSTIETVFSVGSAHNACKGSEFRSKFSSGQLRVSCKLEEIVQKSSWLSSEVPG
jgi:hypothetical protein